MRCLEREPSRRFPDVTALDAALAACADASGWSAADAEAWWQAHREEARRLAGPVEATALTVRR